MNGYEGPARLRREHEWRTRRREPWRMDLISAVQLVLLVIVLFLALTGPEDIQETMWFVSGYIFGQLLLLLGRAR